MRERKLRKRKDFYFTHFKVRELVIVQDDYINCLHQ